MRPILICTLPRETPPEHIEIINRQLSSGSINEDYHIICLRDPNYEGPYKFQCLSSSGTILPADFTELSHLIKI